MGPCVRARVRKKLQAEEEARQKREAEKRREEQDAAARKSKWESERKKAEEAEAASRKSAEENARKKAEGAARRSSAEGKKGARDELDELFDSVDTDKSNSITRGEWQGFVDTRKKVTPTPCQACIRCGHVQPHRRKFPQMFRACDQCICTRQHANRSCWSCTTRSATPRRWVSRTRRIPSPMWAQGCRQSSRVYVQGGGCVRWRLLLS